MDFAGNIKRCDADRVPCPGSHECVGRGMESVCCQKAGGYFSKTTAPQVDRMELGIQTASAKPQSTLAPHAELQHKLGEYSKSRLKPSSQSIEHVQGITTTPLRNSVVRSPSLGAVETTTTSGQRASALNSAAVRVSVVFLAARDGKLSSYLFTGRQNSDQGSLYGQRLIGQTSPRTLRKFENRLINNSSR